MIAVRRDELWPRGDGLFRHRVLSGLLDREGNLVLFKSERVLQSHLDRRAYV